MTGTLSERAAKARLVSPGSVLAPLDSEGRADYLRRRIAIFARMNFTMGGFFVVSVRIHRAVFLFGAKPWTALFGANLLAQLAILAFQVGVWCVARRRVWSARWLEVLDVFLVVGTLTGHALVVPLLTFVTGYRLDQLMVLVAYCVLISHAAIVPSSPRTTAVIGVLGTLPVMAIAVWEGRRRGAVLENASFTALWCVAAIVLTTFTSKVMYGLRQSVALMQHLGQYVIERKIGEGGMGEVYLARHTMLRRPTAVKLLPPERAGAETVHRFEREVRETSRLSHPNTVAIYDYGRTPEGVFYYAMEYLDGLDLQRLVERHGPMPPARVVHVLAQVAGALAEAHGRGLVHRDMKPANVILCQRGGIWDSVKVLDFGLVKCVHTTGDSTTETQTNAIVGTPSYMAPEAITTPELVDPRTDLYAVGAIGYFLLTGELVFSGSTAMAICLAHLQEQPVRPSLRAQRELPQDLEAIILACLAKDPSARPANAAELRTRLLGCEIPVWTEQEAERSAKSTYDAARCSANQPPSVTPNTASTATIN
jgi:eukaryotic-like serine/threonine-protein kinase